MDDLLGIVAFKYDHQANMQASMEKAKDVIKGFKSCYAKDGMKLELEEDTGVNSRRKAMTTQWLQAKVTFKRNKIWTTENNKNKDQIEATGEQKLLRYPHFDSYAPKTQKEAICIQNLIAIERFTTHREDKESMATYCETEMRLLQYPNEILKRAKAYMTRKYPKDWTPI